MKYKNEVWRIYFVGLSASIQMKAGDKQAKGNKMIDRLLNIVRGKDARLDFQKVLSDYEKPLYWHIRRIVVSHDDAQDVLQEAFIKIYEGLPKLKDASALRAWLFKVATNESLMFLRRKRPTVSPDDYGEELTETLLEGDYVDLGDKLALTLQKAVLQLSEQQRLVFNMRYYHDLSYEEISSATGYKVETLKVAYHNAKQRIKDYVLNEN